VVDKVSEGDVFNSSREAEVRHYNHEAPRILASNFNNIHVDKLPFKLPLGFAFSLFPVLITENTLKY